MAMDARAVVSARHSRLTPEERQLGAIATCWGVSVGLALALVARILAPHDCTGFTTTEFFACGRFAVISAVGDLIASASVAALVFMTSREGRVTTVLAWLALGAAVAAAGASPLRLFVATETLSRVVDSAWIVVGVWLVANRDRIEPHHSGFALFLGFTAALSGFANATDAAPRPLPIGGGLFAIVFLLWSFALTRSATSGQPPGFVRRESSSLTGDVLWASSRIALFVIAFPVWLSATFAAAFIGDPATSYEIRNTTDRRIDVFVSDTRRTYPLNVDARTTKSSSIMIGSSYSFVASAEGVDLFCADFRESELRRMHYIVVVTEDPTSCR